MQVRGLVAALNANGRYQYKAPESVVDHLVVGGGVIGLAIAQRLSEKFPTKSTYLVERHARAGEETSSRNSEVIHAGLYYPNDSLKTRLCLRGRQMLYDRCKKYNIPFRKTGKLIVARNDQYDYIRNLHAKSQKLVWPPYSPPHESNEPILPTELLTANQVHDLEPDLSPNIVAGLHSPETGVMDSHALMESFEQDISDSESGVLVYSTEVVRVDPYRRMTTQPPGPGAGLAENGWVVQTVTNTSHAADGGGGESDAFLARTLINASGLSGTHIFNSLLPEHRRIPMFYARGSYAAYSGPGISRISRLIYPCPELGEKKKDVFHSLGAHLTLDLQGKVRFGPDIEWISPPSPSAPLEGSQGGDDVKNGDFWKKYLVPDDSRLKEMHGAVTDYLSGITLEGMRPDYVGIRPKVAGPDAGFQDFVIRLDFPGDFGGDDGRRGQGAMITTLGIESPGLTSCLTMAEYIVEDILPKVE